MRVETPANVVVIIVVVLVVSRTPSPAQFGSIVAVLQIREMPGGRSLRRRRDWRRRIVERADIDCRDLDHALTARTFRRLARVLFIDVQPGLAIGTNNHDRHLSLRNNAIDEVPRRSWVGRVVSQLFIRLLPDRKRDSSESWIPGTSRAGAALHAAIRSEPRRFAPRFRRMAGWETCPTAGRHCQTGRRVHPFWQIDGPAVTSQIIPSKPFKTTTDPGHGSCIYLPPYPESSIPAGDSLQGDE